jgi:hypothetical protein
VRFHTRRDFHFNPRAILRILCIMDMRPASELMTIEKKKNFIARVEIQ